MKQPMFFYKFVSSDRLDILTGGMIRFTPVTDLNDPFELNPTITPIASKYFELLQDISEGKCESLSFDESDYEYSSERHYQVDQMRKVFDSKIAEYGVLSVSSNDKINQFLTVSMPDKSDPRTNLLMWSHYGDSHKGLVIEFEAGFVEGIDMKLVEYRDEREILTFEDIEDDNFDSILLRKSIEWSYEQEYRAILPLAKADSVNGGVHLFKIIKSKVRSITFGSKMPNDKKLDIIKTLKSDADYKHIAYNHARLHDDGYFLDFYYDDGAVTNNPPYGMQRIFTQKKL